MDIAESYPNFVTGEQKCDVQEKCSHCAKSDRYCFQEKPLMSNLHWGKGPWNININLTII